MKKIIYKLLFLFLIINLSACDSSILDIENPNTITEDQFWQSPNDAQKGLNAAYAMFYKPGLWSRWMYFRLDLTSDLGFSKSPWVELGDWTRFQYVNYNFNEGNVFTWRDTYKAVFRTNQVLANVPDIEFSDSRQKELILAQAKFLRAFHYFYAAILWENVPLVLEPSEPDDLPEQNTLEEVWAQVEKDLTDAANVLPVQWSDDSNIGRPTKGAAKAYLAKTYMQQHRWEDAKAALDYFFTGEGAGQYDLVDNYEDNFTHLNENNVESVFEIQFSDASKGGKGEGPNQAMGLERAQFFAPSGIGWGDGQARFWVVDLFKQEATADGEIDPRLQYTLFYPGSEDDFGVKTYGRSWEWEDNEAWFKKYSRSYYRDTEDYFNQVNVRVVRLAGILLMYAEVLNELGQTEDAYQYVNRVRARANMEPLEVAYPEIGNDQEAFLERLKIERVLELCGESHRWAALKRWGDLDSQAEVNEIAQRDPDFENFEVGTHIRLPIPQIEVENNTNLTQNPGY